jgi:heat shock protein HtpX
MFIVNPLSGGGLAGLVATHPPLEDRIRRLLAQQG